ncbi:hypothetical protein FQN55_006613 [Onygenales sp. PD_40]|nr:hypothetical protein FQN55_006613 [Onygenales sp. PD_40]
MKLAALVVPFALLATNVNALVARFPNSEPRADACASSAAALFSSSGGIDGFADEDAFVKAVQESPEICSIIQDSTIPPHKQSRGLEERADGGAGWKDSYGYWHPGRNPNIWVRVTWECANCMKDCLKRTLNFTWRPGVIFDNRTWSHLAVCSLDCTLGSGKWCARGAAATWAARQRTDQVTMG